MTNEDIEAYLEDPTTIKQQLSKVEFDVDWDAWIVEIRQYFPPSYREEFDSTVPKEKAEFDSHYQDGDEIWKFETAAWTWGARCGRAAYVIKRDGKAHHHFQTRFS